MATTNRAESADDLDSSDALPCIVVGGTSTGMNTAASPSDDTQQDYEADFGPVCLSSLIFRTSVACIRDRSSVDRPARSAANSPTRQHLLHFATRRQPDGDWEDEFTRLTPRPYPEPPARKLASKKPAGGAGAVNPPQPTRRLPPGARPATVARKGIGLGFSRRSPKICRQGTERSARCLR